MKRRKKMRRRKKRSKIKKRRRRKRRNKRWRGRMRRRFRKGNIMYHMASLHQELFERNPLLKDRQSVPKVFDIHYSTIAVIHLPSLED